jgi:hypothetical protein
MDSDQLLGPTTVSLCFQLQLCEPGIIIEEVASPGRALGMGDVSFKLHVKVEFCFQLHFTMERPF